MKSEQQIKSLIRELKQQKKHMEFVQRFSRADLADTKINTLEWVLDKLDELI